MSLFVPVPAGERFGTVERTRTAGDFVLRRSRYPGETRIPAHHHREAYFCLVLAGSLLEERSRERTRFEAGSVHFHPAGESHTADMEPGGTTCLSIVPGGPLAGWLAGARGRAVRASSPHAFAGPAARCRDAFLREDDVSALELEAAALDLLAAALRGEGARPAAPGWLAPMRRYLDTCGPGPLSLEALAGMAGVHPVYLVRAFRRHLGTTPMAYHRRRRLEASRQALLETARPLVEIALESGFATQAHFTRAFRRAFGVPPGAFRRRQVGRD